MQEFSDLLCPQMLYDEIFSHLTPPRCGSRTRRRACIRFLYTVQFYQNVLLSSVETNDVITLKKCLNLKNVTISNMMSTAHLKRDPLLHLSVADSVADV